jgi:hypothetical protein
MSTRSVKEINSQGENKPPTNTRSFKALNYTITATYLSINTLCNLINNKKIVLIIVHVK